ncbi:MAG: hypothetical protein H6772_00640 [Pseudomonadales bacterium]|nr:hypothetical protein [Pseudomonadales bacterium]
MNNNLINVDYFKKVFYKSLLPLEKINEFLSTLNAENVDPVTEVLISIFNVRIIDTLLEDFDDLEDKKQFLRMCQDDFQNPKILDFLVEKFPGSQEIISETIERTILSANKSLSD